MSLYLRDETKRIGHYLCVRQWTAQSGWEYRCYCIISPEEATPFAEKVQDAQKQWHLACRIDERSFALSTQNKVKYLTASQGLCHRAAVHSTINKVNQLMMLAFPELRESVATLLTVRK